MGDFAAKTATDAIVVDMSDRVRAKRVGIGCDRERRTPRQADAGMITGASIGINTEAGPHDAPAFT